MFSNLSPLCPYVFVCSNVLFLFLKSASAFVRFAFLCLRLTGFRVQSTLKPVSLFAAIYMAARVVITFVDLMSQNSFGSFSI